MQVQGEGSEHDRPVVVTQGRCRFKAWRREVNAAWFDPREFERHARPVTDGGRGSAWFVEIEGQQGVLRHYRRGGLIARLSRDLYWWAGQARTRSLQEFDVLAELSAMGLRVPRPIAAMACRTAGFFYRAALITERVVDAGPFWKREEPEIWERAGQAIARLHRAGVWHADLNVNNILIDANDVVWLIDFDRARTGVIDPKRLYGNLQRLERSVRKVCPKRLDDCWPMLLSGYARTHD